LIGYKVDGELKIIGMAAEVSGGSGAGLFTIEGYSPKYEEFFRGKVPVENFDSQSRVLLIKTSNGNIIAYAFNDPNSEILKIQNDNILTDESQASTRCGTCWSAEDVADYDNWAANDIYTSVAIAGADTNKPFALNPSTGICV
jgi:hypothetical protein